MTEEETAVLLYLIWDEVDVLLTDRIAYMHCRGTRRSDVARRVAGKVLIRFNDGRTDPEHARRLYAG